MAKLITLWRLQDAFHGKYSISDYEMKDFYATDFPANLFGQEKAQLRERSSLESETVFPAFARACFLCDATPSGQSHTF